MDRYTKRDMDIGAFLPDDFYEPDHILHWVKDHNGRMVAEGEYDCVCGDAIDRMAAYEDTGLTPDEVALYVKCEAQRVSKRELELAAENERLRSCIEQPDNTPLTLDELRQMGGEPVWVQELPPYTTAGYKVLAAPAVNEYGDICFDGGDCYAPYDYGKTWLAYRAKPERSEG